MARHDLTRTSVEAFRSVLQMIREEIGEDSYWLACIAPYAPCLGLADGMRVSNDAGPSWSEGSQGNMIEETLASQYFNNVFWQNDPDCVVLRDERTHLAAHEVAGARALERHPRRDGDLLGPAAPAAAGAARPLALPRARREGHGGASVLGEGPAPEGGGAPVRRASRVGRLPPEPGGRGGHRAIRSGPSGGRAPRRSSGSGGPAAPRPWGSAATSWSRRKGTRARSTTSAWPTRRRPRI